VTGGESIHVYIVLPALWLGLSIAPVSAVSPEKTAKAADALSTSSELNPASVLGKRIPLAVFERNVKAYPHSPVAYYLRGSYFEKSMETERAIGDFTEAIKLNPKFYQAYYARGNSYCELEQYDKALPDLKMACEGSSETSRLALKQTGEVLIAQHRPAEAATYLDRMYKIAPTVDVRAICTYAECLAEANRMDEALKIAEANAKRNHHAWQANLTLGRIHAKMKNYPQAIADMTLAISESPEQPFVYRERALIYKTMGDKVRAEQDTQTAKLKEKQFIKEMPFRMH
jgi:tetratricopeptide (TPR) repeat protein